MPPNSGKITKRFQREQRTLTTDLGFKPHERLHAAGELAVGLERIPRRRSIIHKLVRLTSQARRGFRPPSPFPPRHVVRPVDRSRLRRRDSNAGIVWSSSSRNGQFSRSELDRVGKRQPNGGGRSAPGLRGKQTTTKGRSTTLTARALVRLPMGPRVRPDRTAGALLHGHGPPQVRSRQP